jgi:hypothetical protein
MNPNIRICAGADKRSGSVSRRSCFLIIAALLLSSAHRLPAPIQEVPETPTPAPAQSARPKSKQTVKAKGSEGSESPARRQTPSPMPRNQKTLQQNLFDGTWVGSFQVDDSRTLIIGAAGTVVTEKSVKYGTATWSATCDRASMRWKTAGGCSWTLAPNPDGKTMLGAVTCPGFLGIGAGTWSTTFQRTSP